MRRRLIKTTFYLTALGLMGVAGGFVSLALRWAGPPMNDPWTALLMLGVAGGWSFVALLFVVLARIEGSQ